LKNIRRQNDFFDLDGTLLDHKTSEYLGIKAFYNKYKDLIEIEINNLKELKNILNLRIDLK